MTAGPKRNYPRGWFSLTPSDGLSRHSTDAIASLITTSGEGTSSMSAALKLAAGFGLAAALILVVEALLALFPHPLWLVAIVVPLAAAAVVVYLRNRPVAQPAAPPVDPGPTLSPEELAISDAVTTFNQSSFPRTIAGLRKTLGVPNASVLRSETDPAIFITIAWELSWYQYRCVSGATRRVGLAGHGQELTELPEQYQQWNARVAEDGRVAPGLEPRAG